MKNILGAWIATIVLGFCFTAGAGNPDADNLTGAADSSKRPGDSLVVKIDKNGNKTVYAINKNKKLSPEEVKAEIEKLEGGDGSIAESSSVNPDAEDLGVAPSWYYRGGYNRGYNRGYNNGYYNGYHNGYHHGYGHHSNWGYYNQPRSYNNYRHYNYGYYYRPYYAPYRYRNCNWYYYY
ncbi:hypothetical protein GW915_04145 [bacterium]|nr:hypothetical protein [bacterium]